MLDTISQAEIAIDLIGRFAADVTVAIANENEAIRVRDEHKDALVAALIGNNNPMTNKPHSATSAADAASKDESYVRLDDARHQAEAARILAWANYDATKLRAKLAVIAAGGAL